ncbi:MAG TPA: GNAT family N-acetyltransferase [Methylophilaceae bacterium]|nr:GNAT family N-acetyltransferase [Methylophilaceae bacterium]
MKTWQQIATISPSTLAGVPDTASKISIFQVTWQEAQQALQAVRIPVFVVEQSVSPAFEWDEIDAYAVHLLAMHHAQPIACLRIIEYQKIGRMAVLKEWRNKGLGKALLNEAIRICRAQGSAYIRLSAQTHALPFYQKAGFRQTSAEYTDVHIPHVDMQLDL